MKNFHAIVFYKEGKTEDEIQTKLDQRVNAWLRMHYDCKQPITIRNVRQTETIKNITITIWYDYEPFKQRV